MKVKRITVVGCGLIGASFALALRQSGVPVCLAGWDLSASALDQALQKSTIDEIDEAIPRGEVSISDLVYLAMPVGGIIRFLQECGAQVAHGAIITDAGSTKLEVCAAALSYLPEGRHFVGGHPIAGGHLAGLAQARADLFANAPYVLIDDHSQENEAALATVRELVDLLGARAILTTAVEHDQAMALVSHLPQLISSALAATVSGQSEADALRELAGTGYRSMTRLAGSSWSMWADIFATNTGPIANALDELLDKLAAVRDELRQGSSWTDARLVKTGALFDGPL